MDYNKIMAGKKTGRTNKPGAGRKLFDGKDYHTVIQKLCQAWSVGASDREASSHAGITPSALCAYQKRHPEISVQKDALLETPILSARVALSQSIKAGDGALALKYLERKRKDEFSERREIVMEDSKRLEWAKQAMNSPELSDDISKLMGKIAKR